MRVIRQTLAVCLAVFLMAPVASAQSNVIGKAALDKAVQDRVASEQADREIIRTLLQRQEVRDVAAKAGLSLDKAIAARDWQMGLLNIEPAFDVLRSDPRFASLVARVGLPR